MNTIFTATTPEPPSHKLHGRKKPYTAAGIRRLPCFRCGNPATQQWQICADGRLYRPVCTPCDVGLNALVLTWMRDPDAALKVAIYRNTLIKPKAVA